ncbi:MAG: retroviral-like aspartic protease family protein [Bacteroidia bacterium]|jgi:predicted aspartyl protease|nr:retroviral-like aspartic protease family protein [Bacteroidia bacterium]
MKQKIKVEVLPLEKHNYHLFINLQIDKKPCRLLIDTGASKSVFDVEKVLQFTVADNIIKNDSLSVGLGSEAVETQVVILKKLHLKSIHIKKMEVAVLPLTHVNNTYRNIGIPEIDGVLGSDFLMKYKAILHFKKKYLILDDGK